jgi:MOSC domain-containing protein YiiM
MTFGDVLCDRRYHGGPDQAVYAYAREEREMGRPLRAGVLGENLTTAGLDVTGALIGEHWRVGPSCVLAVTAPRIPCRTFAAWLTEQRRVRRFTERALPGAYLRVVTPGEVRTGDPVRIARRPDHEVTIALAFRALTLEPALLDRLHAAEPALSQQTRQRLTRRAPGAPGAETNTSAL